MNVDRLPDSPEDPRRDAGTRLTDSPDPHNAPPPKLEREHHPTPDHDPRTEREPGQEQEPQRDHPPKSPQTESPTHDNPDPAEPRTRQEHAHPPSTDEREPPAEDEVGTGERTASDEDEIRGDLERHYEELVDQEDRASENANNPKSVTPGENLPAPADDDIPHDRPPPLTDQEWSEHVAEVRDTLDKARADGLTTDRLYTIDPDRKEWTAERNRLQGCLVADLYERAQEVPCDRQAIIAGGLGGAGKTTVLTGHAGIDLSRYLTINPDDIKEEMARRGMIPEIDRLSPMEASDLAHEESSYIAKRLALRAMADGKNIIWDITMSSQESTEQRINNLRDAGYTEVDGIFVDIPPEISITRTELRHREGYEQWRADQSLGGRFVPPEVIRRQLDSEWGSHNRRAYEAMKEKFTSWSIYDNSVYGRSPALIDSGEQKKPGKAHTERVT